MKIRKVVLRYILNSAGEKAVEADVLLDNGIMGRASSPSAIKAGKREKTEKNDEVDNNLMKIGTMINEDLCNYAINDQRSLDRYLETKIYQIGTSITLPISLAFTRASACAANKPLFEQFRFLLNKGYEGFSLPSFLIPVFSGGVHGVNRADSFQQIMIVIQCEYMWELIDCLKRFNRVIIDELKEKGIIQFQAASGGYVVDSLRMEECISFVNMIATMSLMGKYKGIAIDVASEHLYWEGSYHLDGKFFSHSDFFDILDEMCSCYPIVYIEDPFIPEAENDWSRFLNKYKKQIDIIGDDLFATQTAFISNTLANGSVIKLNQIGTVSSCLEAVEKLNKEGMSMCVSHRSKETEDTVLSDLAVAINAKYVKAGNINREERIIKFNQFMRIEQEYSDLLFGKDKHG